MVRSLQYLLYFFLISLHFACVKDIPNSQSSNTTYSDNGVLVLNEGAYGINNAELSFINPKLKSIVNNLYHNKNNTKLGDVAQQIVQHDANYFILVNNSSKIIIVDTTNLKHLHTISSIPFPRNLLIVSSKLAYVSSMYTNKVYILDLINYSIADSILLPYKNPEQMLLHNNSVYITLWDSAASSIAKINLPSHTLNKLIPLPGRASHSICSDRNNKIWILSGNKFQKKTSILSCLNPDSDEVSLSLQFEEQADPIRLNTNRLKDTLYFIQVNYQGGAGNNGLYRMSISATSLPLQAYIPSAANSYFWAYGLHPYDGSIYLSDPKGFTQQSSIFHYDGNGKLIESYQAGIGANYFLFK